MNRIIGLVVLLVIFTGCATHYFRVRDDVVHVYLKKTDAQTVLFASSQNGFVLQEVAKNRDGLWETTAPSGNEFRYFYIIDGKVFIPPCALKEADDYGAENCIYEPDM